MRVKNKSDARKLPLGANMVLAADLCTHIRDSGASLRPEAPDLALILTGSPLRRAGMQVPGALRGAESTWEHYRVYKWRDQV